MLLTGSKAHCRFDIEHSHKLEACVDMVPLLARHFGRTLGSIA